MDNQNRQPEAEPAGVRAYKKKAVLSMMGKQGILLGSSIMLLIASLVYMTFSWYTRTANTGNAVFDIAQWDFSADHNIGDFVIDISKYSNMNDYKAGPGTSGYIPVEVSALNSDTDVNYQISFSMATNLNESGTAGITEADLEELQDRIVFFYYPDNIEPGQEKEEDRIYLKSSSGENSTKYFEGTIKRGESVVKHIYWEWIYEKPVSMNGIKVKIANASTIEVTGIADSAVTFSSLRSGLIKTQAGASPLDVKGSEVWVKDGMIINYPSQECTYYTQLSDGIRDYLMYESGYGSKFKPYQDATDEHNAFDTKVGRNPALYESYLAVKIHILGTQVVPETLGEQAGEGAE